MNGKFLKIFSAGVLLMIATAQAQKKKRKNRIIL
jgi:hypothetical protein